MADEELLSSEERDALLEGVNSGKVDTRSDSTEDDREVLSFDLEQCAVSSRSCPRVLEKVFLRFAAALQASLEGLLRRPIVVTLDSASADAYATYSEALSVPTSLNLFSAMPLPRALLVALDSPLVYAFVDQYFGGSGRLPEGRVPVEFSKAELSMVKLFLRHAMSDLSAAWQPVAALEFVPVGAEQDPRFASIAVPSETVMTAIFNVTLDGAAGELHVVLPAEMLAPLRTALDSNVHGMVSRGGPAWQKALAEQVHNVPLDISSAMVETRISVRELLNLKAGDLISIDMPDTVSVLTNNVSLGRGTVGDSRGYRAIQMHGPIQAATVGNAAGPLPTRNSK